MHKAERAIIMAAGLGQRLLPATKDLPKPMVKVNGVRMIDSVIEALQANGINEIHVVTGYKAEAYEETKEKYPDVDFVYNPYFETRNNISSMYMVREYLHNCICVDGDNLIVNPDILHPEFDYSGYAGVRVQYEEESAEWFMYTDEERFVKYSTKGGHDGWQLYGICRLTEEDGRKIAKYIEEEYEVKKNYDIWWDEIALFIHPEDFTYRVTPIGSGDMIEIDNFSELLELDPGYKELECDV